MKKKIEPLKAGYYIDWAGDMLIVYPDDSYEIFNIHKKKYFKYIGTGDLFECQFLRGL